VFLVGTTSCAAPDRPDLGYLPPSGQPPADRTAFVRQQAWLVWGNILDHLQQRVAAFDEASGKLVVVYQGDPEPYVDCGWIVTHDNDEFDRFPAARSDARLLRRREGKVVTIERDLKFGRPHGCACRGVRRGCHCSDGEHLRADENHRISRSRAASP
jgi:hypothetical protein